MPEPSRTKAPVLRLVPYGLPPVDPDMVAFCRELLEYAEAGAFVGLAIVAVNTQRQFITDAAGECKRDPVFARGMVCALDDDLRRMADELRDT